MVNTGGGVLREGVPLRDRAIQEHDRRFPIRLMCRALAAKIRGIHRASRETDGSPRIWDALVKQGHRVGQHRIARRMRAEGIRAKTVKPWRATTQAHHRMPVAANTLDRQCMVAQPNQVWAGDIPSVWTTEGWLSLAVVLDLYSRAVIGWALGARLTGELAQQALTMAIHHRAPKSGLLHHSDRGSQYAATAYQQLLTTHGMTGSMSRRGNGWDKACVESFFGTLKRERIEQRQSRTRDEATQDIVEYSDVFSHRRRRHATLGDDSPAEFEARTAVAEPGVHGIGGRSVCDFAVNGMVHGG